MHGRRTLPGRLLGLLSVRVAGADGTRDEGEHGEAGEHCVWLPRQCGVPSHAGLLVSLPPFLCEYVLFLYDILASACKRASSLKRRLFARRVPPAVKREQSLRLSQHEEGPPLKEEAAAPATAPAEDGVAMATAIPAVRSTNE
jgi:hypothetical protein